MQAKAVFLDIDGTYLDPSQQVPPSAADAVRAARRNGHQVFLCSGRSHAEIGDEITTAGFDGIIAAGGTDVSYRGEVLQRLTFPRMVLADALTYLDGLGISYILESAAGLFGNRGCRRHLAQLKFPNATAEELDRLATDPGSALKPIIEDQPLVREDINKIILLGSATTPDQIRQVFAGRLDVVAGTIPHYGPTMCELTLPGVNKATAIQLILDRAGIGQPDSIAFGDGTNDFEMIRFVGIGVAMADGNPELIAAADLVAPPAKDDGLAHGFADLGLV